MNLVAGTAGPAPGVASSVPGGQGLGGNVVNETATCQPTPSLGFSITHLNIILPSLALGGAERAVLDVVHGLSRTGGTGVVYVLNQLAAEYTVDSDASFPVVSLAGMEPADQMRTIAAQVLCSPAPVVISHLIRAAQLRTLWRFGIKTIPVIQNSATGWHEPVSNFDDPHVPFIVAVSDDVKAQLLAASCCKPVSVIRHDIQRWKPTEQHRRDRDQIRSRFGVGPDTTLIGMVGQFKAQKAYVRAVRVLASLRRSRDVKLMIVGGWDHSWGSGRQAYAATVSHARELGVIDDIVFVGAVPDATEYMSAFDIFLNTSIYEGLSVATLEAAQLGCPLVLSDVGGQREIQADPPALMIRDPSDIAAYVQAIQSVPPDHPRSPAPPPKSRHLVPQLWTLMADQAEPSSTEQCAQTLFLTSNLNPGGAQRSLTNLLVGIAPTHACWLCVVDQVLGDEFLAAVRSTNVGLSSLSASGTLVEKAREVLLLARRLGVQNIVFWNLDAAMKLLVTKAVEWDTVTLTDVSPGPMLFDELRSAEAFQRRIAFSAIDYLNRLDHFVAKYSGGLPPCDMGGQPRHLHVIPNGVPLPPPRTDEPPPVRPPEVDAQFALVTCCRLVPNKMLDALVKMMKVLNQSLPEASLTVVGGVDQRHMGYFQSVVDLLVEEGVQNVFFVGPHGNVCDFLDQFRVFVMLSKSQGCPNASLEAMAMGLPVIANADGGTADQVLHGRTGFLVDPEDPAEVAARVFALLTDDATARMMGQAGREHAIGQFAMGRMVAAYRDVLEGRSCP